MNHDITRVHGHRLHAVACADRQQSKIWALKPSKQSIVLTFAMPEIAPLIGLTTTPATPCSKERYTAQNSPTVVLLCYIKAHLDDARRIKIALFLCSPRTMQCGKQT
jgi:hypothetical protein